MTTRTISVVVAALLAAPVFAQTHFERPLYVGEQPITLAGEGVSLDEPNKVRPLTDNRGNAVRWRVKTHDRDPYGWQHRFAVQVVRAPWGEAPIDGSSIGLHSSPAGLLHYVDGQQATELFIENEPKFGPDIATARALNALLRHAPAPAKPGIYRAHTEATLVVYTNAGRSRVGYDLVVGGSEGNYHLRIDATTEALVHALPTTSHVVNCDPTTNSVVAAEGVPVRSDVPRRASWNNATGLHATFGTRPNSPYEAHRPPAGVLPSLQIFQGTANSVWWCQNNQRYTIVPVGTWNNVVEYNNYANPGGFLGSEAGDAQLFTRFTMEAFSAMGRNGWNDGAVPAPAKVVTQTWSSPQKRGNASFVDAFGWEASYGRGPANSVLVYPPDTDAGQRYSLEAALDIIAHEFGHLAINYCRGEFTAQDLTNTPCPVASEYDPAEQFNATREKLGAEMHEGFSDTVAHTVEKLKQSAGSGPETSSDWRIGEDIFYTWENKALRDASVDNNIVKSHRFDGWNGNGSGFVEGIYNRAHMLPLAYSLLVGTASGRNPYCVTYPGDYGCHIQSTGIGLSKAGRILFHALRYYVHREQTWFEIPQQMQAAANVLACSGAFGPVGPGDVEQAEVHKAFYQIGYPTTRQVQYSSCP